ncbi:hypothetical protein OF83DRAFT_1115796 [Amylostereum chailletii]|nr:hypothetical protein OF83DRAFT_1115796 [Amylostereum chailletii]
MEEEMRKKRRRIEKIKAKKDLPKTSKAYPCPFKDCASGACESQGIRRHLRESHGHKSLWSCGCGSCFKERSSREAHALRCERAYVLQQGWDKTVSDVKKALDDNNILPEWMETSQVWVGDLGRVLRVWADGKGNLGPRQGRAKNAGSKLPGK